MEHKTDYIYDKNGKLIYKFDTKVPVSYTHLTLPTNCT